MKSIILAVLTLVVMLSVAPSVSAQNVDDFRIKSFKADYSLQRNGENEAELSVREEIVAEFPFYDQNHGILRALPNSYKNRSLRLDINRVRDQHGKDIPFSTSKQNDNTVLKIGEADKYVQGEKTYVISYTMRDVITYYDDHDEFYWNVNGTQWRQPFGYIEVRVHMNETLRNSLSKPTKCFTGYQGSTASNCNIATENNGSVVIISAADLAAGQNLSFVMGFKKGTFAPYTPTAWERALPFVKASPVILLPLLATVWVVNKWRKTGKDPKGKGVIVPQYVPLKGFNILRTEGLIEESVRQTAITAAIIELATARYLTIHEAPSEKKRAKPEYSLELIKLPHGLLPEQVKLTNALFGTSPHVGQIVHLKDLKNKLHSDYAAITKDVMKTLQTDGYFANNPLNAGGGLLAFGILLAVLAVFILSTGSAIWFAFGLGISGVVMLFASRTMPARTQAGVDARDYLLGLKDYIQLAEKDRITYLQSPEGVRQFGDPTKHTTQVKLFETLLPYAMLFGLEKQWAEQFKDLYTQPPDWYQGNISAFHHGYLATSLGSFGSATTTTFTAPSSSGSSGYSGGGGFSGGGGGGGGGGGW